ncbi:GyrI-like domain-containing protein [Rhizobium rhizogenes]|uniref:GyrI-like domain-containing protein n=1 Tax=Rhizobium rhizogenes TaxID=359 RepID=UPI001573433B|nr:GyrI-like domain-containing protein [Rhizobium rhizogenes]NTF69274.1 helix-turn-helix domain-containing protein [Rhizobium rhizogenes]NTG42300.1 helix-turn-helix domain-containing protein [Rhizobium rhizogenes]NTH46548.1 helix-turn-helix domain-containing protein [Rhizobium rhizogenes]NTH59414.1 helix-turn-helix domain-containing protein [Rhizobium rhizogenes]NTH90565.1 helix-turn-helix domain-containing protein [Rhizobium rhizogenes]
MSAIGRAIWFIESHFASDISLDEIADTAGLSRYHLSRVFGLTTGHSISGYIRGRRLSGAALALIDSSSTILQVALDAGYGSHEAFTRAFREQFGMTPDSLRKQGHARNLALLEPIRMDETHLPKLDAPRFETRPAMLLAGLAETYAHEATEGIPSLWQRFNQHFGHIPGQVGNVAYGVCTQAAGETESFRYMSAAEISAADDLPEGFTTLKLPQQRYAVFTHRGHISGISATVHQIFGDWLPQSSHKHASLPDMMERYDDRFDPQTGMGVTEIWIPLKA